MRDRGRKEKERKGDRKMTGQYIIKGTCLKDFEEEKLQ